MASIENIKKLRETTGAGLLDAKNALDASNNDIELAITYLRKQGVIKATKKLGNIASEGIIVAKINNQNAIIIEINSETDFVSSNDVFKSFAKSLIENLSLIKLDILDQPNFIIEDFKKNHQIDNKSIIDWEIELTAKLGEKITVRRIEQLKGENFGIYIHGNSRIGVIVSAKSSNHELLDDIALHIAAMNPKFVQKKDIPNTLVNSEFEILKDQYMKDPKLTSKPKEVFNSIVQGALNKMLAEQILEEQKFVKQQDKTIGKLLNFAEANLSFVRFEVGEGLAKKESNFAKEVENIANN